MTRVQNDNDAEKTSPAAYAWERLEAGAGLFMGALIGLALPFWAQTMLDLSWEPGLWWSSWWRPGAPSLAVAISAAAVNAYPLALCLAALLGGRHPVILSAARRQLRLPGPLRLLAGAWWLAQLGAALIAAHAFHQMATGSGRYSSRASGGGNGIDVMAFMLAFGAVFGSNLFLLMAITAVTRREALVRWAWRWRILIDVGLAAISLLPTRRS
jgi:hypothetical protein